MQTELWLSDNLKFLAYDYRSNEGSLQNKNGFNKIAVLFLFLVGAFSLKEKSPTLTVSSFFVFFSVDNLTLSGPLFLQSLFICSHLFN